MIFRRPVCLSAEKNRVRTVSICSDFHNLPFQNFFSANQTIRVAPRLNSLIGKQPECLRHSQAVIRGQLGKLPPDYGVKTHVEIIAHQLLFIIISYLFETVFLFYYCHRGISSLPNHSWHETLKQQSQENNIIINHIHKTNFIK